MTDTTFCCFSNVRQADMHTQRKQCGTFQGFLTGSFQQNAVSGTPLSGSHDSAVSWNHFHASRTICSASQTWRLLPAPHHQHRLPFTKKNRSPLWPHCASTSSSRTSPSSPGAGICTCRAQGGLRSQIRPLGKRQKNNQNCHLFQVTVTRKGASPSMRPAEMDASGCVLARGGKTHVHPTLPLLWPLARFKKLKGNRALKVKRVVG